MSDHFFVIRLVQTGHLMIATSFVVEEFEQAVCDRPDRPSVLPNQPHTTVTQKNSLVHLPLSQDLTTRLTLVSRLQCNLHCFAHREIPVGHNLGSDYSNTVTEWKGGPERDDGE